MSRSDSPREIRPPAGSTAIRLATLLSVVPVIACAPHRQAQSERDTVGSATSTASALPQLTRLTPDTIALGRGQVPTLLVVGSGFAPGGDSTGAFADGGNTLHVGAASFARLGATTDGTRIRFPLPLAYTDTTSRGRPSAFTPGTYSVTVSTARGSSNALTLTMIP